jgi:hypothetical protein
LQAVPVSLHLLQTPLLILILFDCLMPII